MLRSPSHHPAPPYRYFLQISMKERGLHVHLVELMANTSRRNFVTHPFKKPINGIRKFSLEIPLDIPSKYSQRFISENMKRLLPKFRNKCYQQSLRNSFRNSARDSFIKPSKKFPCARDSFWDCSDNSVKNYSRDVLENP